MSQFQKRKCGGISQGCLGPLPSGYTDGSYGYIPDSSATGDREYMGGFFRYLPERLPYTGAGGEAIAEVAVPILAEFAK